MSKFKKGDLVYYKGEPEPTLFGIVLKNGKDRSGRVRYLVYWQDEWRNWTVSEALALASPADKTSYQNENDDV